MSRQVFTKDKIDEASGEFKSVRKKIKEIHRTIIYQMIRSYKSEYVDNNGLSVSIYKHNTQEKVAIFVKDKEKVYYVFDMQPDLQREIDDSQYCKLDSDDEYHLRQISSILNTYCDSGDEIELTSDEYRHFRIVAKSLNITINLLLKRLGYKQSVKYNDKRLLTQEELLDKLRKFVLDDGITVSLPSQNNEAQSLRLYASRSNMSIADYVRSLGFKYKLRENENEANKNALISEIKSKYIVEDSYIYISPYDRFYKNMYVRARRQGKTIDQFLNELGFERLLLNQLPENYEPYDWIQDIKNVGNDIDFKKEIEKSFVYNGRVYIPSKHYFYDQLFYHALLQKKSINEKLKEWGFVRTYSRPKEYILETEESGISPIKLNLLSEIKNIQKKIRLKKFNGETVVRSRELTDKLKKLYNYQCQVCGPESDTIVMENGCNYVEIHHITPLHNAKVAEDEEDLEFDNYRNLICLCPFHHKYVHYHKGGNYKLNRERSKLINSKGEELRIIIDFHLK
ncbi:hypothetical protein GCM10022378_15340 [Salinicoccus jeotgali]|uniref:HNH nuclease domain-containing protein n=1 Tax=Salinicoccus jeotgali TaxID=381634 RepID=A0ABP7EX92_9STAP